VTAPWEFAGKLVTGPIPLVGSDTSDLLNTTRAGVVELATASVAELDRRLVALREHAKVLASEVESLRARDVQLTRQLADATCMTASEIVLGRLNRNLDEVEKALEFRALVCYSESASVAYRDALRGIALARKESA
jgi:hypothetical protein